MFAAVPDIDENIALPVSATEALPEMTPTEELQLRAKTITFLADIQGKSLGQDTEAQQQAERLARQMMEDPKLRPDYAIYPNETIAYLAGMVSQINHAIVDDLAELKLYVVNKLVLEVEKANSSKDRIAALKAIGEIDGVDAFKRRTETTITYKPIEEVEKELMTVLEGIEYHVVEAPEPQKVLENPENSAENAEKDGISA